MPTIQEQHFGIVTDNDDPEKRGRIKAKSQSLLGAEVELPEWIEPDSPLFSTIGGFGSLFIPDINSTVELVVDVSDTDMDEGKFERFIQNPSARWRHTGFTESAGVNPTPDELLTNYPKRRGFKTPSGHVFLFDDADGQEQILAVHKNGKTYWSIDKDGSVLIMTETGSMVYLDNRDGSKGVKVIDAAGNSISLDSNGIKLIDKSANIIEMKSDAIQIIAQQQVILNAQAFNIKAGATDIGDGAIEHLVKGEDLILWLNAHTHPTPGGPSSPPTVPALPTDFLSTDNRVK